MIIKKNLISLTLFIFFKDNPSDIITLLYNQQNFVALNTVRRITLSAPQNIILQNCFSNRLPRRDGYFL